MKQFEETFPSIISLLGVIAVTVGTLTGNIWVAISGLMMCVVGTSSSTKVHIDKKFEELYKKLNKGDDTQ